MLAKRARSLRLRVSVYIAILVHNDVEGPEGTRLQAGDLAEILSTYVKTPTPFTMDRSIAKLGQHRARNLKLSFSLYIEYLIRRDCRVKDAPLMLFPRC